MRTLVLALSAAAFTLAAPTLPPAVQKAAAAEECTGENCPPPAGKHECEHEKKEETVS